MRYYRNIADFEQRLPKRAIADRLRFSRHYGRYLFGANVRIEGAVHLRNPTDTRRGLRTVPGYIRPSARSSLPARGVVAWDAAQSRSVRRI